MYCVGSQPVGPSGCLFQLFFPSWLLPSHPSEWELWDGLPVALTTGSCPSAPNPASFPRTNLEYSSQTPVPQTCPPVRGNSLCPVTREFEGEMHPAELRVETLYDLPSQSRTPAFLRRQKREPQRSNEAGSPCCQGAHREQRLAPDGLHRQDVFPLCLPWEQDTLRFKIPGPKG